MTVGNTNLTKISKDPKLLFYYRNRLRELGLISITGVTQYMNNKGNKCILLRLKRFHKPLILTTPQAGIIYKIIEHLKEMPNLTDSINNLIKNNLVTLKLCRKIKKTYKLFQIVSIFSF